jgi:uncharacterized damage-inducible protein DinB
MSELPRLIGHCVWANGVWIDFIAGRCPGDERLLATMAHILLGEQAWFQRIGGQEVDKNVWAQRPIAELREIHLRHRERYALLLREDPGHVIAYRRFNGDEYQSSVSDILLHLCLHGTHHRGQMATYASGSGVAGVNTDYINYCRLNRL